MPGTSKAPRRRIRTPKVGAEQLEKFFRGADARKFGWRIVSEQPGDELGLRSLVIAQSHRIPQYRWSTSDKMAREAFVICPYHAQCVAVVSLAAENEQTKPHMWRCAGGGEGVLDSLVWGIHMQNQAVGLLYDRMGHGWLQHVPPPIWLRSRLPESLSAQR